MKIHGGVFKSLSLNEGNQSEKAIYCILYYFNSMRFLKRQNYRDNKKISGCQGVGKGWRMSRWSTEDFQGGETVLYGITVVD
jgi:hypothetical protein